MKNRKKIEDKKTFIKREKYNVNILFLISMEYRYFC